MSTQQPQPGGRDAPRGPRLPRPTPGRRRFGWGWWVIWIVGLLALNYWTASRATEAPSRVRVPYSPFFLQQVDAGHVASITTKGTAVQGNFKKAERYGDSKPTTRFRTEIPTFANTDDLSSRLAKQKVVVNAQPLKSQHAGPHPCERFLQRVGRGSVISGRGRADQFRFGQRLSVDLAAGRQRPPQQASRG